MVKNLPANAGDTGSTPGPGGFHMVQDSWALAATTELTCPGAHGLQQDEPPQWEDWALQLKKACEQQWRPITAKN